MRERTKTFLGGYAAIGVPLGIGAAVLTFIGAWIYCVLTYGFLFGLGLGWLPAIFLAAMVGGATFLFWAVAIVGGLVAALALSPKVVGFAAFGMGVGWLIFSGAEWLKKPKGAK
jgi:hypothetical protein